LPGVGKKSADCIMMYSLGMDVLPVDIHVSRISQRLGLVKKTNNERIQQELELIIPARKRLRYHVNCVQHGRAVCRGQYPKCGICCLSTVCPRVGIQ
jgi:endonuclease III